MNHPLPTRRSFLAAAAAAPLALARAADRPTVIDAHLHCFAGKDDPRFPYHARAPYRPDAAATPEHLLKCLDGAGVDFAVVVHPEPYGSAAPRRSCSASGPDDQTRATTGPPSPGSWLRLEWRPR